MMLTKKISRFNFSYKFLKRLCHSNIYLNATPTVAMHDVLPSIKVQGLIPGMKITLDAEMFDDKGKKLVSNAHFITPNNGQVDVSYDSSVGGSYKGVFPSGLLSTLKISEENFAYGRISKDNLEIPLQIRINLRKGHEPLGSKNEVIDSVLLERHFIGPGVKRIPVNTGRIRGTLFLPQGEGPYPGIIDMYGATGTFVDHRGALNASRGIASLSLAYFNYQDIPAEKIFDLDLDYFEEAMEYLLSQPGVIPDRCGVLGSCQGGFIAQYMGIHFDKVKAVLAANFPFSSFDLKYKGKFIFKGPPFEYKPSVLSIAKDGIFYPPKAMCDYMNNLKSSFIEHLHRVKDTHFHYAVAEDDIYKFIDVAKKFWDQLSDHEKTFISYKSYPKAGHMIDPPYNVTVRMSYMKLWSKEFNSPGLLHHWGGEPKGDVNMQEDIWEKCFEFFNYHIRDKSPQYQQYLQNHSADKIKMTNN